MTEQAPPTNDDERIGVASSLGWDPAPATDGGSVAQRAREFFTVERLQAAGTTLPAGLGQPQLDEIRDAVVRRDIARNGTAAEHDRAIAPADGSDGATGSAGGAPDAVASETPEELGEESFPASDPPGTY